MNFRYYLLLICTMLATHTLTASSAPAATHEEALANFRARKKGAVYTGLLNDPSILLSFSVEEIDDLAKLVAPSEIPSTSMFKAVVLLNMKRTKEALEVAHSLPIHELTLATCSSALFYDAYKSKLIDLFSGHYNCSQWLSYVDYLRFVAYHQPTLREECTTLLTTIRGIVGSRDKEYFDGYFQDVEDAIAGKGVHGYLGTIPCYTGPSRHK